MKSERSASLMCIPTREILHRAGMDATFLRGKAFRVNRYISPLMSPIWKLLCPLTLAATHPWVNKTLKQTFADCGLSAVPTVNQFILAPPKRIELQSKPGTVVTQMSIMFQKAVDISQRICNHLHQASKGIVRLLNRREKWLWRSELVFCWCVLQ